MVDRLRTAPATSDYDFAGLSLEALGFGGSGFGAAQTLHNHI